MIQATSETTTAPAAGGAERPTFILPTQQISDKLNDLLHTATCLAGLIEVIEEASQKISHAKDPFLYQLPALAGCGLKIAGELRDEIDMLGYDVREIAPIGKFSAPLSPAEIIASCSMGFVPVNLDLDSAIIAYDVMLLAYQRSQADEDLHAVADTMRAVTLAVAKTAVDVQRQIDRVASAPLAAWAWRNHDNDADVREDTLVMLNRRLDQLARAA